MTKGTPVNRQWIVVLKDGSVVIDWGDGLFQDVRSGDFLHGAERDISHHIIDDELAWLVRIGRVQSFDTRTVHFFNLPERPQKTIE
jgi:hypothetical protein